MNSKSWIRKAFSLCLSVSLLVTYSMVALAGPGMVAGELLVSGSSASGGAPTVFVNGETAKSGRSVFSSSTIVTSENTSAILSFGKLGKLEIAPNSSFTVSFDEKAISGELTSGKVSVLSSAAPVNVRTINGALAPLNGGQSVLASGTAQQDKDDDDDGGGAWWIFAAVFVAAGGIIVYAAVADNDRATFGDGGVVVSPTR